MLTSEQVIMEVSPTPKSISYSPRKKRGTYKIALSALLFIIFALPAILIMIFKSRSEYLEVGGEYSNLFIASVSLASFVLLFNVILAVLKVLPIFIHRLSSLAYIDEKELKRIERAPAICFYLASAISSSILFIFLSIWINKNKQLGESIVKRPWEYFFIKGVVFYVIFSWLMFVEKLFVQKIAVYFHSHFYSKRLETNEFLLNCISRLRLLFMSRRSSTPSSVESFFRLKSEKDNYGSKEDAERLAEAVFSGLSIPAGQDWLEIKDLETAFAHEAERFFDLLDNDHNGKLTKQELVNGIIKAYEECDLLETSLISNSRVINRLEQIILVLIGFILFYICLSMLMSSFFQTISFLGAGLVAANFLFAEEISEMFTGIIFVIITHPFDIGDCISIDGQSFKVRDIDLTLTTLQGPGSRLIYINNHTLAESQIGNIRRSGNMQDNFKLAIEGTKASRLQFESLQMDLDNYIREHNRDFEGNAKIGNFKVVNRDNFEFEVTVRHRANFQDAALRNKRKLMMVNAIRRFLQKNKLNLAAFTWDSYKLDH